MKRIGNLYQRICSIENLQLADSIARKVKKGADSQSIASYRGWAKHCDSRNLIKKLLYEQV